MLFRQAANSSTKPLLAISRFALPVACLTAIGAISTAMIDRSTEKKTKAMAAHSQQCQDDLKTEIAQMQDYLTAKKAEQAAGIPRDPKTKALLDEKMKAIQAFKSRC